MIFSKQFKALAKVSGVFAGAWAVIGAVIGALSGPSRLGVPALDAAITLALGYGLTGAIAGVTTALLVARAESGRPLGGISTWRMVMWGIAGGMAPAALFSAVALMIGAPMAAILPLAGIGVVGGVMGGLISGSAFAAAKRSQLGVPSEPPQLPMT